jgi:hypothetical protein
MVETGAADETSTALNAAANIACCYIRYVRLPRIPAASSVAAAVDPNLPLALAEAIIT